MFLSFHTINDAVYDSGQMKPHYLAIWTRVISSIDNVSWLTAPQTSYFLIILEQCRCFPPSLNLFNWWHFKCGLCCSDDPTVKYEIIKPHHRQRCCLSDLVHCYRAISISAAGSVDDYLCWTNTGSVKQSKMWVNCLQDILHFCLYFKEWCN